MTPVVVQIGRNHVLVKARNGLGYHVVDLEPHQDQPPGCSCKGFEIRGTCYHWRLITKGTA